MMNPLKWPRLWCRGAAIAACLLVSLAYAAGQQGRTPPEIAPEASAARRELLRLRIVNAPGGNITASRDGGATWLQLGTVVKPARAVNGQGYTASKWARDSAVAAVATNGIHIKIANDKATGRGIVLSLCPGGKAYGEAEVESESGAVVFTDIPGGDSIFGGGIGPLVNDPVAVERAGKRMTLPPDYVPAAGDVICITRTTPERLPSSLTFQNKFGGLVTIEYPGEQPRPIAVVLHPVCGVGRFEGQVFAGPGRIRANHCGVIDVSTAPYGCVGGFQIIPRDHASSPELFYVKEKTQWMVVGPLYGLDRSLEALAPLFAGFISPSYRPDEIADVGANWLERVVTRCAAEVRIKGGPWRSLPHIYFDVRVKRGKIERSETEVRIGGDPNVSVPLPGTADGVLKDVTDIRIVFQRADFWPGRGAAGP